jgi:PAS domain-containing protein
LSDRTACAASRLLTSRRSRTPVRSTSAMGHSWCGSRLPSGRITERKHNEEAAQRLAAILESSDDAIVSNDLAGIITTWNGGAERLPAQTSIESSFAFGLREEQPLELPARLFEQLPFAAYLCDRDGLIVRYNRAAPPNSGAGRLNSAIPISGFAEHSKRSAGGSVRCRLVAYR